MSWIDDKAHAELARVRDARQKQVYPYFREFESGGLHTTIAGRPLVNFSSNDYLGLTNHPKVKEAAKLAVDKYACGLSSSRPQATTVAHVDLEKRLASFFGYEKCLTFTTGYQSMVGLIAASADKDTTLVLDAYSHACILDGTFLAAGTPGRQPEVRFFNHNSVKSLERILKTRERKNAMVFVEGVYSLDGDTAPLREIVEMCEKYEAVLVVDDAHGSGTLGKHGRGTLEALQVEGRIPILMTAFSKSFGAIGGAILAKGEVIEMIQHNARSFLFSASLPGPIVAAVSTTLEMLETDGASLVSELHQKRDYMRKKLLEIGFDLSASDTHIMPVMCRDERKTLFMHIAMLECGVLMVPLTYPSVKQGEERLRVNITRGHTQEDLDLALDLLKTYGDAFFVISGEDLGPMEDFEAEMGAEVILPLPSPRSLVPKATQVKGAWLASSVRSLRSAGAFDRYIEIVAPEYRELLRAPAASEWYPIEMMVAHYTAAEALNLPAEQIVEIGRHATAVAHHTVVDIAVKLAVASGATTPWTAIQQLGRLWARTFVGGGVGALKLGPKEARIELVQWPCCTNRYVRAGVRGVTLGLAETFCQKAYVHEIPEMLTPWSLGLRLSWV